MPVPTTITNKLRFQCHQQAKEVPRIVIEAMEAQATQANHILPSLFKYLSGELPDSGNTWFIVYGPDERVLYVASCNRTPLGDYPLFIFTTIPTDRFTDDIAVADMKFLSDHMSPIIHHERIYSVFAIDVVAEAFANAWYAKTGIEPYRKPFYDCTGSFCTKRDLKPRRQMTVLSTQGIDYEIRRGTKVDIPEIAVLCELFAQESARLEATLLVEQNAVWVHRVRRRGTDDEWEIASIAACTRNTATMATITKVYTNPDWRRNGCAERLTREVCKQLFAVGKEKVALFVGNDNPARFVYDKVGFVGLRDGTPRVQGVDRWLEIGFDKHRVRQGHC
ncbi:hypothetical protein CC1G_04469 [Coprinopsis cinerea okayama7|uniref:N-acetyltransferase domain-containing protein n=1 Tax=Coprinopsis cinerea (strain Okayama-7 / 130 / ATCC MYA-4618 / FGSC 9003) TaxID=240176 RepID=A8N591_COPC7|nr:hypothetical protein CC1G_04469 [Coprinopsis cinerea okayama7\|eukprot:XP_001830036.2 hypothetical protein CC1G_04469 [Coprinopsis cinerea okayama7\